MTFSERMKDFMEKAGDVAQDLGEKGYKASREFVSKAGAKAQDMGERGVLMIEIKQLEIKAQKQLARLGTEVYKCFRELNQETLSASDSLVKSLLDDISETRAGIEKRVQDLENR